MGTSSGSSQGNYRPVTSNKAAKFTPQNQAPGTKTMNLDTKLEKNPEEQFKKLEKDINKLLDESSILSVNEKFSEALEKAKEAVLKEKNLKRQRELQNMSDNINLDITYSCMLNLAIQYQNNGLHQEALQKYNEIIKSKQFPQAGRLRVNIGNIYFQQKKYTIAIKMYRMALDVIPATSKEMR